MEPFKSPARLEWWAKPSMCIGEYEIDITVTVDPAGVWSAQGRHSHALDTTQREGWDFLVEMDPCFSLAFPGEERGHLMVRVDEAQDGDLILTEAQGWDGSASVTFDLT
ncbi:hypothetical protein ABIA35_001071 [Catenulispora sp. MAP12-49]|uniref:hypothetical protein n=1 Tax=Catenulispora sp. MAP12-49 TaxID=3156302 RepID=UPI0035164E38